VLDLIYELFTYARKRRRFLILPPLFLLLLFGAVFLLVKGTALAPLIYTIF
jgi:hypothetical protein